MSKVTQVAIPKESQAALVHYVGMFNDARSAIAAELQAQEVSTDSSAAQYLKLVEVEKRAANAIALILLDGAQFGP